MLEPFSGVLKGMLNKLEILHNRLVPKFHRNLQRISTLLNGRNIFHEW